MPYVLKLHFDPDFERRRLRPKNRDDGTVDQFDLGYVQNVVTGQTLAEWEALSPEITPAPDAIVSEETAFLHGEGCRVDPENPLRLVATVNGHVASNNGQISVREKLSIAQDVDFHIGNIVAIGDVHLTGNIRPGFTVMGRNVTIEGTVESANVTGMGNVLCQTGIQGGNRAIIRAGKSLRARYCENAVLHAVSNILIDGSSMHCRLFAGEKLAVKGRLVGGEVYCGDAVYIGEQLGGGGQSQTRLLLGYDPERIHKDQHLKAELREELMEFESCRQEDRNSVGAVVCEADLERRAKRLETFKSQLNRLWANPESARNFASCRVIVPGHVGANVEIGIGEAVLAVPEGLSNVVFRYQDGEIITEHPALRK